MIDNTLNACYGYNLYITSLFIKSAKIKYRTNIFAQPFLYKVDA